MDTMTMEACYALQEHYLLMGVFVGVAIGTILGYFIGKW